MGVYIPFRITLRVSNHLSEDMTTPWQLKNEQSSAAFGHGARCWIVGTLIQEKGKDHRLPLPECSGFGPCYICLNQEHTVQRHQLPVHRQNVMVLGIKKRLSQRHQGIYLNAVRKCLILHKTGLVA